MKRTLPPLRLSRSPLALVLCQIRTAAIRDMESYIPRIQDRLRREDFPIDLSGEVQEVAFEEHGLVKARRRAHWEFRTVDECWSIVVSEEAVVLQTTVYTDFDAFLARLSLAAGTVSDVVGDVLTERIGLRYVDLIRPEPGESWKQYIVPGFHGLETELVRSDKSTVFMQVVAETGPQQQLIARVVQNREGMLLPLDLMAHPPALRVTADRGELLTLLDIDHYRQRRQPFEPSALVEAAWELHDGLDILFRDMVTAHALEVWT